MNSKDINTLTLGTALAEARKASGISQVKLASLIGVDKRTLCSYEKGRVRIPGIHLITLVKALNISFDAFVEHEVPKIDGRTKYAKIMKELERLPKEAQQAVFTLIDSFNKQNSKK